MKRSLKQSPLSEHELERRYCAMLDDCYPLVKVAFYEYERMNYFVRVRKLEIEI